MMRKGLLLISLMLTGILAVWSCHKEAEPGGGAASSGFGGIRLRLSSSNAIRLETRATDLEEGLEFNNVLVILVNNSGNVVDKVYKTYPYTPAVDDIQDAEADSSVEEDVIHFQHLLPGNYHVYAYANIDAATWQDSGSGLISAQEKTVATGASFASFEDRLLASLSGTAIPADPSQSMLLTGHKVVQVGLSLVQESLDLLRPVVRLSVIVRNNTDYPVSVEELRFSRFNPDKAYLLGHTDASGVPSVPSGVTYRKLPDFDPSGSDVDLIAANSEETVYQRLLYENACPESYKIYPTLGLDRTPDSKLTLSLGEHPFGLITYDILQTFAEDDQAEVLLINPRKQTRSGRLYYGIGDSGLAWESCGYDSYQKFVNRATAIFNEESSFAYAGFSYSGYGGSNSGMAGWTGNSADAPFVSDNSDNIGSGATFHYTGARSRYFRTLKKEQGGTFSIEGLRIDGTSDTSISDLVIKKGSKNGDNNNRFAADVKDDYLVRFAKAEDNSQELKSDCLYNTNNSNPDNTKGSRLTWEAYGSSNQDHQFMLFGQYSDGGLLRRILKDNNKEVPLTYMARNEDIKVVINVYYSDQKGSIYFEVDNDNWATATESNYTFE